MQGHWNGLPCPTPGDLPIPGIEAASLMSPVLVVEFFTTGATLEALLYLYLFLKLSFIIDYN